jgi:hypothetical protein
LFLGGLLNMLTRLLSVVVSVCLYTAAAPAWGDDVAASFDFKSGPGNWTGRTADTKDIPEVTVGTEGAKDPGTSYISVQTNGKLGTGLRLKQTVSVTKGNSYVLSFWVRVGTMIPVSYRLISATMDGPDYAYGDQAGTWHPVPNLSSDQWTKVEYPFVAASSLLGVDIVAAADHPAGQLSVYDPRIVSQGPAGTPVATYDFSQGPGNWGGRTADNRNLPPVTVDTADAQQPGKPYISVSTDGKLGTGFRLKQSVSTSPGSLYRLDFWVRETTQIPISYRLIGGDVKAGDFEYGDQSGTWHLSPPLAANTWTKIEYSFTAATSPVGVDIAAGTDHPAGQISLFDPEILKLPFDQK